MNFYFQETLNINPKIFAINWELLNSKLAKENGVNEISELKVIVTGLPLDY